MTRLIMALGLALLLLLPLSAQTRRVRKVRAEDKDLFAQNVTHLRRVDRIVVTATGNAKPVLPSAEGIKSPPEDDLPANLSRLASLELKGEKAEELWRLWRGLKNGNGAGCFAPGYLLDFYAGGERVLRTQVCFHCCNVTIPESGIRSICGDERALKLFRQFVTREVPYPQAANNE
jgi:hypothetical protein